MVETGPRKDRKVREEPTADSYHFNDNRTGYYLCAQDEISNQTLKQGSYAEAKNACTEIFTPQVCKDPTFTDRLLNLALDRMNLTTSDPLSDSIR